jgi:hypothetical protein
MRLIQLVLQRPFFCGSEEVPFRITMVYGRFCWRWRKLRSRPIVVGEWPWCGKILEAYFLVKRKSSRGEFLGEGKRGELKTLVHSFIKIASWNMATHNVLK